MKNPAEEKKARSSMSSTFGSVMNPDMRDFKVSLDQVLKQKKRGGNVYGDNYESDHEEVVSIGKVFKIICCHVIGDKRRNGLQAGHDL